MRGWISAARSTQKGPQKQNIQGWTSEAQSTNIPERQTNTFRAKGSMSDYRRAYVSGGCYFFTVVTYRRRKLFADETNIGHLRDAFRLVKAKSPFDLQAIAILPDHLHCLWRLPDGDADFSRRWRDIKNLVSRRVHTPINRRREKQVWQRRFWEHAIRDEEDWKRHLDYIHYNPVKHGYVASPGDWPYSSFRKAVVSGLYTPEWGSVEPKEISELRLE